MASTDIGLQQVSFHYQQQLSSVLGNQLLYGNMLPGAYNVGMTLTKDGSNLYFNLLAGTTMAFWRQVNDPNGNQRNVLVKAVLGADTASGIFLSLSTVNAEVTSKAYYVVGTFDTSATASANTSFAGFSIETDASIGSKLANNGTASHSVVLASVLNLASANPTADLTLYRIAYDYEAQRNTTKRQGTQNTSFNIDFEATGSGVYLYSGNSFTGDSLASYNPTFAYTSTGGVNSPVTKNSASTNNTMGLIAPASPIFNYYPDPRSNSVTNITGSLSSYAQVDFLRIKTSEINHMTRAVWESFIVPLAGRDVTISAGGLQANTVTQTTLTSFIAQYSFPIIEDGQTVLIAVRDRNAIASTNIIWPEQCLYLKDLAIFSQGAVKKHNRLKLPVWNSTDLGYQL